MHSFERSSQTKQAASKDGSNRRTAGRLRADGVETSFGKMLDLSATGMRLRCGRVMPAAGSMIQCGILAPDGEFVVMAHVVWARKLGVFVGEVGLEFTDIKVEQLKRLNRLATYLAANSAATVQVREAA